MEVTWRMSCADLYRSVILQALKDAVADVPLPLPVDPPPGFRWKQTKHVPTTESAWRKRRQGNAVRIAEVREARDGARRWLTGWSDDFVDVCRAAEVDPASVRARALALEAAGWPAEEVAEDVAA